jgi:hypothetical protein
MKHAALCLVCGDPFTEADSRVQLVQHTGRPCDIDDEEVVTEQLHVDCARMTRAEDWPTMKDSDNGHLVKYGALIDEDRAASRDDPVTFRSPSKTSNRRRS